MVTADFKLYSKMYVTLYKSCYNTLQVFTLHTLLCYSAVTNPPLMQ